MNTWTQTISRINAQPPDLHGRSSNPYRRYNPADRLPPAARSKLDRLREAAEDARSIIIPIAEKLREAADRRAELRTTWARLTNATYATGTVLNPQYGPLTAVTPKYNGLDEDDRLVHVRAEYAAACAAFDRLTEAERVRTERWSALAGTVGTIDAYLANISDGQELTVYSGPEPTIRKNESPDTALTRVRKAIAKAQNDLVLIERAPLPASMVKAALRKQVDALADACQPNVLYMIDAGDPLEFPSQQIIVQTSGVVPKTGEIVHGVGAGEVQNALGMIAWLFKDEVLARLDAEIDKRSDEGAALDYAQRAEALVEAKAKLLTLEREEEALVEASPAQVFRRPDADPRAVLGISGPEVRQ